jgi:regulatory protein
MRALSNLMDYALYLLGRQRYTVSEMGKKLFARLVKKNVQQGFESVGIDEQIATIISRLIELKLLDDYEYATLYIQDQLRRKPQGLSLLKRNMTQKGLSKEIISKAITETVDNPTAKEFTLARQAANKKLKTLTKIPPQKQRKKLVRFLFSRGFSPSVAIKVVNSKLGESEEFTD